MRQRAATLGIAALVLACAGLMWVAWSGEGPEKPVVEEAEPDAPVDPFADAALTGRVLDPEGEGVDGATVVARRSDDREKVVTTTTLSDGRFGFDTLEAGSWLLDARADTLMSPGPEQVRAVLVDIEDDVSLEADLTLRRPAQVSGEVVAGGKPLVGLPIDVHYSACRGVAGKLEPFTSRRVGATGPGGRFSVPVAPCRFKLVVRDRKRGKRETAELRLADGARRSGLRLDFAPGGRVEGVVKGAAQRTLRATVTLTGPGLRQPKVLRTQGDGVFRFADIPGGTYTLTAVADAHAAETVKVRVRPEQVTAHDFTLREARGLTGKVVDSDGRTVSRVRVVVQWGGGEAVVSTDHLGRFSWSKPGVPTETVRAMAVSPRHTPSTWASPHGEEPLVLRLGKGGLVSGTVVDPNGQPVFPSAVSVVSMDVGAPNPFSAREIKAARVGDPSGTFRIGPLRPGRYTLRGESQRHGPGIVADILVSEDHETSNVEVRLSSGSVLRGRVSDSKDAPIKGARVILFVPGAVMPPRVVVTNAEGEYHIGGLPPGRFSLRVRETGYLTALTSGIELRDGEDARRDVTLRKPKKGERFAFQGIGATLTRRGGGIAVGGLIPGGPASGAGLRPGDVIRTVDGQKTSGKGIRQVVEWIRGEPGSTVEMEIVRGGQPMRIAVERGNVVVKDPAKPRPKP